MDSLNLSARTIKTIAIVGALALIGLVVFLKFDSAQRTMVAKESALSGQYQDNQNELSSYVSTIKEQLGIADRASDRLDQVLADAVKGRYEGDTSANPANGALFSAITEAYPDLSQQQINYANVQSAVASGRQAFKDKQTKTLDMLRSYDSWRNSGFIQSKIAAAVGAPSTNLRATIGDKSVYGTEALDQMRRIVLTSEAKDAFESGEMDPLDLNPTTQPSVAPVG